MNLVNVNPVNSGRTVLDELFNDFFGFEPTSVRRNTCCNSEPLVNILEEKNKFIMELTVPGINREDIAIDVEKDQLVVKSKVEEQKESPEDNFTHKEFFYGNFTKKFHIPEMVDKDQIHARFENGILRIDLMKREEAVKKGPKHIEIK
jgi:HSP20 family protein